MMYAKQKAYDIDHNNKYINWNTVNQSNTPNGDTLNITEEQVENIIKVIEREGAIVDAQQPRNYRHFEKLNPATLKQLIEQNLAHPREAQNRAPSLQELSELHRRARLHGYLITGDREDRRISVEGAECTFDVSNETEKRELVDWLNTYSAADEFTASCDDNSPNIIHIRFWYD